MCGFVGVFNKETTPNVDLTAAAQSIYSRGPDMQGIKHGYNWKIAFNRLSIHDLSDKGMQPFRYEGVIVYMNGEIFNYLELQEEHKNEYICKSASDVEIIPFLYKKYGLSFLDKLNGMFSIILIDERNKVNYLFRDRFGEKPLYYHFDDSTLYFASEVKAIKKLKKLEVDKINIQINFSCWFLPQPLTLYKETFNVTPGSYIEYKNGNILEKRWYSPHINITKDSEIEIKRKFIELYKSSIAMRLRSDVPVGIFLSGGLDSTSIAKFAKELNNKEFFAFGAEIVGKVEIEKNNTDARIPKKLSKDLNISFKSSILDYNYYNVNILNIVKHYDEIFMDSGVLVFYELSRLAKKNNISVILTGVGGDELFGGYPWQSGVTRKINKIFKATYGKLFYSEKLYKIIIKINKKIALVYKILTDYKVWHAQTLSDFNFDFNSERASIEDRIRYYANKYFTLSRNELNDDVYNIMGYANTYTVLGAQNRFSDIATMKYSVENRSPLLDYRVREYMMSIPDDMKVKYGQKGLMRSILKDHLPNYVIKAKKSGPTMPLMTWFYDHKRLSKIKEFIFSHIELVETYLSSDITNLIRRSDNSFFKKENSLKLFAILNFILWAKFNLNNSILDENMTFDELINLQS